MNSNTQKIPEVKQKPFVKWGEEDNGGECSNKSSSTDLDVTNQVPRYYDMGVLKEERLPLRGGIKMSTYSLSMSSVKHVLSLEDSQSQEAEEWVMLGEEREETLTEASDLQDSRWNRVSTYVESGVTCLSGSLFCQEVFDGVLHSHALVHAFAVIP